MEKQTLTAEKLDAQCSARYKTASEGLSLAVFVILLGYLIYDLVKSVRAGLSTSVLIASVCAAAFLSAIIVPMFIRRIRIKSDMTSGRYYLERAEIVAKEITTVRRKETYHLTFGSGDMRRVVDVTQKEYRSVSRGREYFLVFPECARGKAKQQPAFYFPADEYDLAPELTGRLAN